uniref:Polyadenylate-binding protein 1-like isoform X2 n=1 Tax=Nicotiana tabacum TaxID=4097 RepID=A0A1S4BZ00_TOBAC|nr:PREDICTED: polyadenylate-binding protein 1-like isoform X2 [Nicotiana tabacum]
MEHQENEYEEHEHEVYGGDIPDEEGEMDAEYDETSAAAESEDDPNAKELENMKKRLKEIEDEAGALREMEAKVEKEMGSAQELTLPIFVGEDCLSMQASYC